jgi:hypothetical protein
MAAYHFRLIEELDLPDVAAFLREQQEITSREDPTQARPSGDDLRWMLGNPHRREGIPLGETLRAEDGKIVGMIVAVPRLYRLGDKPLLGLAAGHFFVDAAARLQGFFILRRFMGMKGADFWYANSCNRQSGPVWAKCGAALVPESDVEYLFPFRLGPLIQEVALRKGWPAGVGRTLRALGPIATLAAAPRSRRGPFRIEYTIDFERISSISDRWRRPGLLQPERSVSYLRWLYGSLPPGPDPDQRTAVYAFSDGNGREGWFALAFDLRGRDEQIRCARLMDVVWPQERTAFTDVLPAIAEAARTRADVLAIRGRVGLGLHDRDVGLRRRALLAPEGFLFSRSPATAELAPLADLPFADRY